MHQSACSTCNSSESNEKVQGELSQTCGNLINGSSTEAIDSAGAWAHPMLSFLWRYLQVFGIRVKRTGPAYFRTALQKSVSCLLKPHSGRRERVHLREQHLSSFLRCYNWFLPPFGDCGLQSPMFLQAVFRRRSLWLAPVANGDRLGRENLTVINKRQKLIDSNPCTWIITSYPFCLVWQLAIPREGTGWGRSPVAAGRTYESGLGCTSSHFIGDGGRQREPPAAHPSAQLTG